MGQLQINLQKGNCLELMKEIPDRSVDMILCDLPYGTTRNKWDSVIPFDPLWEQYKRIIKENGAIVLFSQPPFDKVLACSNLKMFRYEWIWDKVSPTGHLNAKKMPMKKTENILVFYKKLPTYNPQGLVYSPRVKKRSATSVGAKNYDTRWFCEENVSEFKGYPTNLLKFKKENGLHPTQKSVPLLEYLIKTYTNENELVLDNCMGSGSTGVACFNTNRRFIGMEIKDDYFQVAQNRIKSQMKQLKLI